MIQLIVNKPYYYLTPHNLFVKYLFADSSISAPPSFKPAKKYSDISGLIVIMLKCLFMNTQLISVFIFF